MKPPPPIQRESARERESVRERESEIEIDTCARSIREGMKPPPIQSARERERK
jgi:hypothetical protein